MNKQDLSGRAALVTGASSGIEQAAALALAECGADVAVNFWRNREGGEETARAIAALGRRSIAISADVSKREGANELIAKAPQRVAITTFASNVARLRSVANATRAAGRELVVVGRAMYRVIEAAQATALAKERAVALLRKPFRMNELWYAVNKSLATSQ